MRRSPARRTLVRVLAVVVVAGAAWLAWYLGSPLFVSRTVDEAFPGDVASQAGAAAASGAPLPLGSGQFGVVDSVHRGEGTAVLLRLPSGQHVLRLADFKVTNGPDLYVYLSGHAAPRDSRQLHDGGALEVARLKGNVGSQNYELPMGFDPAAFRSAVIYCKQFGVVFSTAELVSHASGAG